MTPSLRVHQGQADLGYAAVEGIDLIPIKRRPGQAKLDPYDTPFNTSLAAIRAAVERAVAHVKPWRMLSEKAGRFRLPLEKLAETLKTITGKANFRVILGLDVRHRVGDKSRAWASPWSALGRKGSSEGV